MSGQTQISAHIAETTKQLVEDYATEHGVKKGHLVEQALLHHLQALRELPADVVIPPRILISRPALERIVDLIEEPREPTAALRALFGAE